MKTDNNGYWDPRNWNENEIRINSNHITMRPDQNGRIVPGPVYGIGRDRFGNPVNAQMMQVGQDYYYGPNVAYVEERRMWDPRILPKNFDGNLDKIVTDDLTQEEETIDPTSGKIPMYPSINQTIDENKIPPYNYQEVLNPVQNEIIQPEQIKEKIQIQQPVVDTQEQQVDEQEQVIQEPIEDNRRTYEDVVQMQTDLSNEGYYDYIKNYNKRDLMSIQQKLIDAGYNIGNSGKFKNGVDGIWGPKTQAAWRKYNIDGKEGYFTRQALQSYTSDYGYSYRQETAREQGAEGTSSTNTSQNNQVIIDDNGHKGTVIKSDDVLKAQRENQTTIQDNEIVSNVIDDDESNSDEVQEEETQQSDSSQNVSSVDDETTEKVITETEEKDKIQKQETQEKGPETDPNYKDISKVTYSGKDAAGTIKTEIEQIEKAESNTTTKNTEEDLKIYWYKDPKKKKKIATDRKERLENYKRCYETYEFNEPGQVPFPLEGTDYIEGTGIFLPDEDLRVEIKQLDFSNLTNIPMTEIFTRSKVMDLNNEEKVTGCMGGLQLYLRRHGLGFFYQEMVGLKGGKIRGKTKTNAWTFFDDMVQSKNSEVIFNGFENYDKPVYTVDPEGINYDKGSRSKGYSNEKWRKQQTNVIEHMRKVAQTDEYKEAMSNLKPGDIVGLFYAASDQYLNAATDVQEKEFKTYNTHVGVVVEGKNGKLYVWHNVHGNDHKVSVSRATNGVFMAWSRNRSTANVKICTVVRPGNTENIIGDQDDYYDCSSQGVTLAKDGIDYDTGRHTEITNKGNVFCANAYRMYGTLNQNKEELMYRTNIQDDETYNYVGAFVSALAYGETMYGNNSKVQQQRNHKGVEDENVTDDKHTNSEKWYRRGGGWFQKMRAQSTTMLNIKFSVDNFTEEELKALGIYDLVNYNKKFDSNEMMEETVNGKRTRFKKQSRKRDEHGISRASENMESYEYEDLAPDGKNQMNYETAVNILNTPEFSAQAGQYVIAKQIYMLDKVLDMVGAPDEMKAHNKKNEFYTAMMYMIWNQGIENEMTQKTILKAVDIYKSCLEKGNMSEYKKYVHDKCFHNDASRNVRYIVQCLDFNFNGNKNNKITVGMSPIVVTPKGKHTNNFDYFEDYRGVKMDKREGNYTFDENGNPVYDYQQYNEQEDAGQEMTEEERYKYLLQMKAEEKKSNLIRKCMEDSVNQKIMSLSLIQTNQYNPNIPVWHSNEEFEEWKKSVSQEEFERVEKIYEKLLKSKARNAFQKIPWLGSFALQFNPIQKYFQ